MSQNIFNLQSKFSPCGDQPKAIKDLVKNFRHRKKFQTLLGVTGSGKTFTMANVIQQLGKKTLILAPNKTLAAQLYSEFKEFFPDNAIEYFVSYYDYYRPEAYLPGSDTYIEKDSSINDEIDRLRHSTTKNLSERDDVIVISSVSCIYGIGGPSDYEAHKIHLFTDEQIDRDDFLKELVKIQYTRNDIDFSRGNFRVRGETVEVFLAYEDSYILRVEFFDDIIESLRLVDPLRGTIIKDLPKISIYPSSHYVIGQEKLQAALKSIKKELKERLHFFYKNNQLLEKQRLEMKTLHDLEMLEEMGTCSGIENYSRHMTQTTPGEPPPTLIDFFGDDFLLIIDESHITIPQVRGMYLGDRSRKTNLVEHGFRLPSALDNRPLNFEEFEKTLNQTLFVSATPGPYELEHSEGELVEQIIRPTGLLDPRIVVKDATYQVDDMLKEIKTVLQKNERVIITTLTKKLAEELTSYYKRLGLKVKYLHADIKTLERIKILTELREGVFDIIIGINLLREGIDLPEVSLIGIMDADKEGYLRSYRSLIQIIGRAARNENGRVILYAYQNTKSMMSAINETHRRRKIQENHNKKHNIIPTTISKEIQKGVLDTLKKAKKSQSRKTEYLHLSSLNLEEIEKQITILKKEMKTAARNLDFELAAKLRDRIKELTEARLIL